MPAKIKSALFKPLDFPNPFLEGSADKAYADILGDKMKEARWWRITGAGCLALFAISLIMLSRALNMQQTVPVLVNVMPTGEAVYLGEVRQGAGIQVPEAAIHFQLRRFVTNLRSISTDPMVLYNNINECFAMVTNTFAPIMTNTLRSASPFELVGRVRRQVEISSIIRTTGTSYQIDWYELSIYGAGTQRTARFRAIATIVLLPPDPSTIRLNPLGIFIENFQMTEL